MQLGLLSAILGEYSFEEMIDIAAKIGYKCIEVACWPSGKAERRYAGVSHINVDELNEEKKQYILDYCQKRGVKISAMSYYPNPMDANKDKRQKAIEHLLKLIEAASFLNVDTVGTFIGRVPELTIDENIELFKEIWPPIIKKAEKYGVKIAIENCPMLFTYDEWPGGQNIATTPAIWRKLFDIIPSENFGLNYDPSHFIWQQMDYLKPLYEFKEKIFHVHFKDIKIYPDKLNDVGVMATPLEYMAPKLPGLGDIKWDQFVSALYDIGYEGYAVVEVEDKSFEGTAEKILDSVELSYQYMRQFVR